jgi:hypothetical protein
MQDMQTDVLDVADYVSSDEEPADSDEGSVPEQDPEPSEGDIKRRRCN